MEEYVKQLLADIATASKNARFYFPKRKFSYREWISEEEEEKTAIERQFDEWTGIRKVLLPPEDLLTDEQVKQLIAALLRLIDAYHLENLFFFTLPERLQYTAIRENFDQIVKVRNYYRGSFEFCRKGTQPFKCVLGPYCLCTWRGGVGFNTEVHFELPSEWKNSHVHKNEITKSEQVWDTYNLTVDKIDVPANEQDEII